MAEQQAIGKTAQGTSAKVRDVQMVSPPSPCKTVGSVGGRAHARTSWSGRARHVPERRSQGDSHGLSGHAPADPQVSQSKGDGDGAPQTSQADSPRLQFTTARRHPGKTDQRRWPSLNRSGQP